MSGLSGSCGNRGVRRIRREKTVLAEPREDLPAQSPRECNWRLCTPQNYNRIRGFVQWRPLSREVGAEALSGVCFSAWIVGPDSICAISGELRGRPPDDRRRRRNR